MKIGEIAALAGVSPAAVSRYLNNGPLSEEKKEVIARVIAETGYIPDATARSLRTGKVPQMGVIIPRINSNAVGNVTAGIASALMDRNYLCLLANTNNDEKKELEFLQTMQDNFCAGIILLATVLTDTHERLLSKLRVPCVIVGQKSKSVPCVYHDDFNAIKALTELMIKKGRRKICYLGTPEADVAAGLNRRKGFEEAMKSAGLYTDGLRRKICKFSGKSGYTEMEALLNENDDIDGVVCATDSIAMGAMTALRGHGKRLPEDVSITGLGDSWVCTTTVPPLTTAHFYYRESGEEAAKLLVDMIENEKSTMPVKNTMLGYSIVERKSI